MITPRSFVYSPCLRCRLLLNRGWHFAIDRCNRGRTRSAFAARSLIEIPDVHGPVVVYGPALWALSLIQWGLRLQGPAFPRESIVALELRHQGGSVLLYRLLSYSAYVIDAFPHFMTCPSDLVTFRFDQLSG